MSDKPRPLDIAEFVLKGEGSPELKKHMDNTDLIADNAYLERVHTAIGIAEEQVMGYMFSAGDKKMPKSIDIYDIADLAVALKRRPFQLATLLVDTIILAAGQIETFDKSVRWQAIMGITEALIQQADREGSPLVAADKLIRGLLNIIERRGVRLDNTMHRVSLHARKLILLKIAEA